MPSYTITGRVLSPNGIPIEQADIVVWERSSLTTDISKATARTDETGTYVAAWTQTGTPATPWDLFVRATYNSQSVDSALISDPTEAPVRVDLVLGAGSYQGRSEWDRITAKVQPLLDSTAAKDVPADRLEWLAKRADVFPLHLAMWVQAHRLADGRTVKPESCYAFLRAGLPADLPSLLRAGEAAYDQALRAAWRLRILSLPGDGSEAAQDTEAEAEIAAMRELVVEAAITSPSGGTNHRVVFDTAGLSPAEQQEFMELWVARTSLADFWGDVENSPTLGAAKAALFQFTAQASMVVGNHMPALVGLQAERVATNISTVRDLAAWDHSDWDAFLDDRSIAAPDHIPGANATEKRQNYARSLERVVEDAYPTLALRHRIARDEGLSDPPANTAELVGFFDDNPGFDITRTNIARYVSANPGAFSGATDAVLARKNLEIAQRVHRLAPRLGRYDTAKVLLDNQIGSAKDVVAYTRNEFVGKFGGLFGSAHHSSAALAGRVWDRASKIDGMATMLASTFALSRSRVAPSVLAGVAQWTLTNNGLDELAGVLDNLDYCACEECRSVFSPAAYLADLLQFLADRPSTNASQSALDKLELRRPDIGAILLDCANTNTSLPMIDLVNEALEAYFVGPLTTASAKQTTWPAEELALHPEHLDASVYEGTVPGLTAQITEMVFPWNLPFSLPALEAKRYLGQLGVAHADLMKALIGGAPLEPTADELVAAGLGITPVQRDIIAGAYDGNTSADDREFWGFAAGAGTDNWFAILNGTDNDDGDVGELLRRAGLELADLEELIDLTFIDPNTYAEVGPIYTVYSETCNLSAAQVINLEEPQLDRLHRFLRLERATAIPRRMLNVLIDDLGGTLDGTFLAKLVDIRWLHDELGVDWDELAAWWAPRIDARQYETGPSALYRRRFYTPEISPHADFAPNSRGDALFGEDVTPPQIADEHIPTLLSGAGLTATERAAIQTAGLAGSTFTFANITAYFRVGSFARANRLRVDELIRWIALTGIDPFTSPANARASVEALREVRKSGFALRELDWLLRHPAELEAEFRDDAVVTKMLERLALDLARIDEEVKQLSDPTGDAIRANLASILDAADAETAMGILDKTSPLPEVDQGTFVDTRFASFTDPVTARARLVTGGGDIAAVPDRFTWLLREFVGTTRRRGLVVDTLAPTLRIDPKACRALLLTLLTDPAVSDPPVPLMTLFEGYPTEAEVDAGITRALQPQRFVGHDRLVKAARIVERFRIAADQIAWYSSNTAWLDLDALPLSTSDADLTFEAWNRLRAALDLRALFPADVHGHRLMAEAASVSAALATLGEHTGWDVSSTIGLEHVAVQKLGWASVTVFEDELGLARLRDIAELVRRLGVSAKILWSWVHDELDLAASAEMKQAVRANYAEAHWPDIARRLRNQIREEQRDALVSAILAQNPGMTRKQLGDALLVDIDMGACMLTSRIKQAIGSVQAFIHRAQLGLEPGLPIDPDTAQRWEWSKNYRVWEANRKVFLYPENWIEPSLRRDKTPEFAKLESALAQGPLDAESIELALVQFLERVDAVAKLEIVSTFQSGKELWVVGRSQQAPRKYYLRQRRAGTWKAWEEIPLPIEGDNVVVVDRGARTYLFWLTRSDATKPAEASKDESADFDLERIGISWAERKPSGWSPVGVSPTVLLPKPAAGDAQGEIPDPRYLLKTKNTTRVVELRAYVVQDTSPNWVFQQFVFDPSVKRVAVGGLGATENAAHEIDVRYEVDGQRYVAYGNVDKQFDLGPDTMVNNGTTFRQGPFEVELFQYTKQKYERGFVHQSDQWRTHNYFAPQFFDNHELKYLISPELPNDTASSEGASVQPLALNGLDWLAYAGVEHQDGSTNDVLKAPEPKMQAIKDGVHFVAPWQNKSPGVLPSLFGFGKALNHEYIPAGETQAMLEESKNQFANADVLDDQPGLEQDPTAVRLRLEAFHHPYTDLMIREVSLHGVRGLYDPVNDDLLRQSATSSPLGADALDVNTEVVLAPIPVDEFDFSRTGAYSAHNWEIFFHAPLLIAGKLAADQRHAEAQRWYHAIFNPLQLIEGQDETASSRAWRLRPFVAQAKAGELDQLEAMLGIGVTEAEQVAAASDFAKQVEAWLAQPFDPHAVARTRPGAYMRAVFMKYLDNLLAWGDQLFRGDTIESINEAMVLYLLAAELLGPRPTALPEQDAPAKSYNELSEGEGLDAFSNAKVQLENWLYLTDDDAQLLGEDAPAVGWQQVPLRMWYFCYPPNPRLLEYWDRIADRLWKIRNCRNIDGITRHLPLFEPPIDPGLLVQATAAGVDLASILGELAAGMPPYRFRYVFAKAMDFCGELRALGSALLAALEKRDAEALALLRAEHEVSLLEAIREVRVRQLEEARAQLDAVLAARPPVELRKSFYRGLIEGGVSSGEKENLAQLAQAEMWTTQAHGTRMLAGMLSLIPNLMIGTGAFNDFGGVQLSAFVGGFAEVYSASANTSSFLAGRALTNAQYLRREEEWHFQRKQAELDLARVDRDIVAARIRVAIAERELDNHDRQVQQSREVDEFLRSKFSGRDLYDWMATQLSGLYWQTYELAFDLAKRAETAYRHELAIAASEPRIVQFGYWDGLRKGLLAGERLSKDLRRLEKAHMERDVREFELRKTISLAELDPVALRTLQETGECDFALKEALFDLDHPGHYLRRIRAVRLTIPAVVGPHTSLGARLELVDHRIRFDKTPGSYPEDPQGSDLRFRYGWGSGQAIATSTAMADGGLFSLDFRDERYLPFEYAGAISSWKLRLPDKVRQFDYRTISDVIVHVDYTARDGGEDLRDAAEGALATEFAKISAANDLALLVVVQDAFPNEWEEFLRVPESGTEQKLALPLTLEHFPYYARRLGVEITEVSFAMLGEPSSPSITSFDLTFDREPANAGNTPETVNMAQEGSLPFVRGSASPLADVQPATWELAHTQLQQAHALADTNGWLDAAKVTGLLMLVHYTLATN